MWLNIRKIQNGSSRYLGPLWSWVAGYMRMMIIMISRNCSVIKACICAILFGKKTTVVKVITYYTKNYFITLVFHFSPTSFSSYWETFCSISYMLFFPLCNILDFSFKVSTNYCVLINEKNIHSFESLRMTKIQDIYVLILIGKH